MSFLSLLSGLSRVLMLLISVCFFYQMVYLVIPFLPGKRLRSDVPLRHYAVLVAARNEEAVLPHLLDSLNTQDYPKELIDIFVVADNCTDATAQVAREHGATVFTRFNRNQVGKGYALDYLLERISSEIGLADFDAFLIFDADNLVAPDYIRQMNRLPAAGYDAFCGYRNSKNFATSWISSGHSLWYLHESSHMNRSRMRCGVCCHVNGTGFGFTRALLEKMGGWHFFTLTEDIEFNNWCATHGVKTGYCHDAVLYDEQPITFSQSWKQRTRWAQGGYQVILRYFRPLARGIFRGGWQGWSCFEMTTISACGFGISACAGVLSFLVSFLTEPLKVTVASLCWALVIAYFSLMLMGVLTLALVWKRIQASGGQKLASVLTFPLYMMTFAPISFMALFQKFRWEPIRHTVAISAGQLRH